MMVLGQPTLNIVWETVDCEQALTRMSGQETMVYGILQQFDNTVSGF